MEQLERRGIDPVEVLHDEQHGLLGRHAGEDRDQRLERPLLAERWRGVERRIPRGQRD